MKIRSHKVVVVVDAVFVTFGLLPLRKHTCNEMMRRKWTCWQKISTKTFTVTAIIKKRKSNKHRVYNKKIRNDKKILLPLTDYTSNTYQKEWETVHEGVTFRIRYSFGCFRGLLTCFLLSCLQSVSLDVAICSHGLQRSKSHACCSCLSVWRAGTTGKK